MRIKAIEHIALAMPAGGEAAGRAFYSGLLGIPEVVKPPHLEERGGCWFESDDLKVTLAVDPDFRPASRAHPAFVVDDLEAFCDRLAKAGVRVRKASPLEGYAHAFVHDPFGNRIELMAPLTDSVVTPR